MISPKVVKKFLNRKLDSYDWIKTYKEKELSDEIKGLNPSPKFGKTKLWLHQKACFLLMVYLQRFLLFLDMGTGKTLLCLSIIKYRKRLGQKPCAIVFVPYITAVHTWIQETEKHTPKLKCVPLLYDSGLNKEILIRGDADLYVICYQSAVAMASRKIPTGESKKIKWVVNPSDVRKIFSHIDMMVLDECHKVKNHLSMTYRLCRAISNEIDWVFGLTGTPFGRDLIDLWSQFYIVDLGQTLGTTLGMYREAFFDQKWGYWGGVNYKFKKKLFNKLQKAVKNRSIRYKINECHDMPPRIYITKKIQLTNDMINFGEVMLDKMIKLMIDRAETMHKSYSEIKNIFVLLSQLSSGFMTLKSDVDKKIIAFPENPKLDLLMDLIDEMPKDSKMIVFHNWVYSNKLISKRLTKNKIKHARVWGGQKDQIGELKRFERNKTCRVLILNSQSGSTSLNLQHANYVIFFEQPRSAIERNQAERRVWRPGQNKKVFIFDLIMENTFDQKQNGYNKQGRDLLKNLLDGKEKIKNLFKTKVAKKRRRLK